jgi:hypothetical protein
VSLFPTNGIEGIEEFNEDEDPPPAVYAELDGKAKSTKYGYSRSTKLWNQFAQVQTFPSFAELEFKKEELMEGECELLKHYVKCFATFLLTHCMAGGKHFKPDVAVQYLSGFKMALSKMVSLAGCCFRAV